MAVRLQVRRDTSINWSTNNPILQVGEFGFDTTVNRFKVGIANDGDSRWNVLPYLNVIPSELKELAQDFVEEAITAGTGITKSYNDTANTLTIAVDSTIANKTYVDDAIDSLGNTVETGYIPLSLKGNVDGVAELDEDGYVPQTQLTNTIDQLEEYVDDAVSNLVNSAPATLDTLKELSDALGADANFATTTATALGTKITATSQDTLRNKTISISNGITSVSGYDNIEGFFGQSNIVIFQDGVDKGGKINISSGGVITVASSGLGYQSGLAIIGGGTRVLIEIGGNTLIGTKAQFNAAMTDADFATLAGTEELTNKTLNSPNINQPYGLVKGDVGLGNVDNTSDQAKPISSAAQTALDLKQNRYASIQQKSTNYQLQLSDANTLIEVSANATISIPTDVSVNFPKGTAIDFVQTATATVSFAAVNSGVTIVNGVGTKLRTQWSSATLIKRDPNLWVLVGDLIP
jgi:hypothetical protein